MTKKASTPLEVTRFEQIPNVGKAMAQDFQLLGIKTPQQLGKTDPYKLYVLICEKTKSYHDPCVLDTYIAATRFMKFGEAKSWWAYTEERKKNFHKVLPLIEKFK